MHIARIGADKNVDCKHPNVPVGRGMEGASELNVRILNRKAL